MQAPGLPNKHNEMGQDRDTMMRTNKQLHAKIIFNVAVSSDGSRYRPQAKFGTLYFLRKLRMGPIS